jgi:hypothetical protein
MMRVVREDKTDNQDIDVEKQYGDLHLRVIFGHIRRERYEDNRNENKDVNPEQTGIDSADKMELAVMIQPETCENQKSDNEYKDFREKMENLARKYSLSLGAFRFGGINTKHKNSHRYGKDAIDHSFQSVF